ncbi:MAG: S-layer homology domain-containing protein [bacterium]
MQWQIEVRYASRPVTRLSSPDPYNRQWLDPESIQDVIASYSPDGVYDQVMVYWQNGDGSAVIPSWGWGLALPYFPSQVWGYLTVTAVRASYWNPSTADIWSQVWIHEWLHCASSFYASKGYPMPVGDADGGEYHGYAREERGLPGWGAFYSDLMQGRVLEGSQRFGITRDAWLSGSIATEATTTTTQPPTTTTTVPQGQQFSDVSSTHPYYTQIADLAARTISKGFPDGLFHPDASVTRQQFAKMIVKTLGLTVTGSESCLFADVGSGMDATDPFYPGKYVAVCALHGITQGKTQTTFAPYDDISRQQLITMVARSAGLSDPPADYAPPFLPAQFYPEEHYLNARKAAYAHLLDGLQGMGPTYGFLSPATRGEVCALLYNLLHR